MSQVPAALWSQTLGIMRLTKFETIESLLLCSFAWSQILGTSPLMRMQPS